MVISAGSWFCPILTALTVPFISSGSLILKLRPQEDLSYLSVIRRELNVQTLVLSLQGSFASLRHNLFLGNRALAVVAVYCHDVMAEFFNARRHIDIVR